ncbi:MULTISPECIES: AfsR/SARP family transcriptional regulator [Streptomyces]|uniref:AfsR/SARP family transcriptional regulator n=1 Tax=Streptomyces TaxID=1883 RepID=UPI000FDA58E1|nr:MULTISPECIES: AfsR/SARP family transcriptional regulator [unclassified Streptomyces]MCW1094161.1 AfsR/SARP family transcriptional regulator [Streptomyces sp. RS2]
MEIKVLGPLSAVEEDVSIVPSATKLRQLLALLCVQGDRIVTVATLMEELWGESPPKSASSILQTYVLQLRQKIARAIGHHDRRKAKDVLVTQPGGYLLRIDAGELDCHRFDRLAKAGHTAAEAGNHRLASDHFTGALALWRGPALVDVRVGNVLQFEALRMNESRMAVLQQRIEADIQIGRHAALVPELEVLVAQNPLNENLCAQLMISLQYMGCSWRALRAYQQLREALDRELGLEPSASLQEIHHTVLVGEPARSPLARRGGTGPRTADGAAEHFVSLPHMDLPYSVTTR